MAAADEIFEMFETTITSYEEELARTREENTLQRQQLDAVSETPNVIRDKDVQEGSSTFKPQDPQPPHIKEEYEELWITREEECIFRLVETDLTLTVVSVKTEDHDDKPPEFSHHLCPADVQQLIPPHPHGENSTSEIRDPQHLNVKEEEGEVWATQEKDCFLGSEEADLTKLPLTVVSVKTEDHYDKSPEFSHHLCPADVQQLIPPHPHGENSTSEIRDPQHLNVKEEEGEVWATQEKDCFLGSEEADLTKLPLTVVSVKTEDHDDKPPEFSHHLCPADVQQLIPPHPHGENSTSEIRDPQHLNVKEEEGEVWATQEKDCFLGSEEADLTKLPLTVVSVKTEDHYDKPPEFSHHLCPADVQQLIPPHPHGENSTSEMKDPQHLNVKEEEGEVWATQEKDCFLGSEEADLTKLPLTVVSVKTEDHDDKPPEFSHHLCPADVQQLIPPHPHGENSTSEMKDPQHLNVKEEEGEVWATQEKDCFLGSEEADLTTVVSVKTEDDKGKLQGDNFLAPLSEQEEEDRDDSQEAFSSDTVCEDLTRTHTDNKHSEKKTDEEHSTCSLCDQSFSKKTDFTRHMRTHTGGKPFKCLLCDERFTNKASWLLHMSEHTRPKPFSCSVCDKIFSTKAEVTRHMRTHTGEKPFSCSVCDKSFSRKKTAVAHMRTHTGEKPFSCSVCDKKFSQKIHMLTHMRTHTWEKPCKCSICDERFTNKASWLLHMSEHTRQKPFSCAICDIKCSSMTEVTRHIRTHTGEKPFSCSVCSKSFSLKASVVGHMRTHTGEKPFSCTVCGKGFALKPNMTSHTRTHAGEKHLRCSLRTKHLPCMKL
ncbi:uncharacterized protein [Nerophis lumbriciformis]|uniref:uncharacterized protein n=1 Tax=Nerophis lumbriciformis TaxID=546530 RepID=UPI002AE09BE1|nr:zinc finger protein ZFP2-like [Nerophis lumbriciformis]